MANKTQWIDIKQEDNKTFSGYLALPPSGSGPGLLLLQEIWGVNEHIRTVAEQYALSGFVVLAPDVFWRLDERVDLNYDEAGTEQAFDYMKRLDKDQAADDLAAAVQVLKARPEVTGKVGVMGYCMGGMLAYRTAAASDDIAAAVCYYGGGIADQLSHAPEVTAPIMFHHGVVDDHIPFETAVSAVKAAFSVHPQALFYDYPQAGHGFNCWGRPSMYHQPSATLAQGRTLTFLADHLY